MENTVDRRLSLPWKEYENLQKLVTFKTSEDALKHWYQQSRAYM